jgi:hypothetical protein
MAPASLSFVAFTITITRIALSPLLVEAAPAPYPDDERAASTSRQNFFRTGRAASTVSVNQFTAGTRGRSHIQGANRASTNHGDDDATNPPPDSFRRFVDQQRASGGECRSSRASAVRDFAERQGNLFLPAGRRPFDVLLPGPEVLAVRQKRRLVCHLSAPG